MGGSPKGWRISGEAYDGDVGRERGLHEGKAGGRELRVG